MPPAPGELLVERFEKVERIDFKSAKDVVTEVDHLSEALIIDAIRAAYPGDGIIAEESGEHVGGAGDAPTAGVGRAWIIDPLDGTINYANGIPFFCVSIALVEAGRPVVGVIHDPMRGETFAATDDGPATARRRADRGLDQGAAVRLRRLDGAVRAGAHHAAPGACARPSACRARWAPRRSPWPTSATAGSTPSSSRAGCPSWDVAAAGLIAERGGATVTNLAGGPWFDRRAQAALDRHPRGARGAPPGAAAARHGK